MTLNTLDLVHRHLTLDDDILTVVDHADDVAGAVLQLQNAAQVSPYFGFDLEHTANLHVRLVQLATAHRVYVFDIVAIGGDFPDALSVFLQDPTIIKMGVDVYGEFNSPSIDKVKICGGGELSRLHRIHDMSGALVNIPFKQTVALATLASAWLGVTLDKTLQDSDWSSTLSTSQYRYAALDAVAALRIYDKMMGTPSIAHTHPSYWIFGDIDHFTSTRLGLREDHPASRRSPPPPAHDPNRIPNKAPVAYWHPHHGLVVDVNAAGLPCMLTSRERSQTESASLRDPHLLPDERIHYALYPLDTVDMGSLFSLVSLSGEDLLSHVSITPRGTYALSTEMREDWERLELMLKGIGDHLFMAYRRRHGLYGPNLQVTMPHASGYRRIGTRAQVYTNCLEAVKSFKLLSAYVSFTMALWYGHDSLDPLAAAQAEILNSPLGIDVATWQIIHSSIVCRFGPGVRVGGFIDPCRSFWGHSFARLARANVSIWLLWGRERGSLILDPSMLRTYYPPPHVLSRAKDRPIGLRLGAVVLANIIAAQTSQSPVVDTMVPQDFLAARTLSTHAEWEDAPDHCFKGADDNPEQIPMVWTQHCELYAQKERSLQAQFVDTPDQQHLISSLLNKVQKVGHVVGTTLYIWRYERSLARYQRHRVPDSSVDEHWDDYRPICRMYWPFSREWDLIPFTSQTPSGAVVCVNADTNAYYFDPADFPTTIRSALPEATDAMAIDSEPSQPASPPPAPTETELVVQDNNTLEGPSVESYLRERHGYQFESDQPNALLSTSPSLPVDSKIPQESIGFRFAKDVSPVVTAAIGHWFSIMRNRAVLLQQLPVNWDLRPSMISPQPHRFQLQPAISPNNSPVYLLSSAVSSPKPAFWSIALFSATAVLYLHRATDLTNLHECARRLLQLGIPFRTVISRQPGSPPLLAKPYVHNQLLRIQSKAKDEPRECYFSYLRIRERLLQTPIGRAARLRAGILGLLARSTVRDERILSGPVYADELVAIHGQRHFYDDSLTENIGDMLVGAFYFGGAESALRSYWPRAHQWEKSRYGCDQWLYDALTYVAMREKELEDDSARMKTSKKWTSNLKQNNSISDEIRAASEALASTFIDQHLLPSVALTACMCVYVNDEHHPAAIEPANDQQHMPASTTPTSTYIRPEPTSMLLSIMIEAVISVPTSTDLDHDRLSRYIRPRPAPGPSTLCPLHYHHCDFKMTQILILSHLLSRRKRLPARAALVIAAETALTQWKAIIDARLGFDAADVEFWVIAKHANHNDPAQHATLRGYIADQPVGSIHLQMSENFIATGIQVWRGGVRMTAQPVELVAEVY
ncbi:hypothetical protein EYR36_002345 [Pleurotus pulmonarius]|nr:hypothetical protein EYR36_002345 [Pleurotus pulmonarius]